MLMNTNGNNKNDVNFSKLENLLFWASNKVSGFIWFEQLNYIAVWLEKWVKDGHLLQFHAFLLITKCQVQKL